MFSSAPESADEWNLVKNSRVAHDSGPLGFESARIGGKVCLVG